VYRISPDEVRQIELETIENALGRGEVQSAAENGLEILPRKNPNHERHFWRRLPQPIGASKGEQTEYIYVLYHISGAVHGYPLTRELLREKGVNV
jgi:hypothetical protein